MGKLIFLTLASLALAVPAVHADEVEVSGIVGVSLDAFYGACMNEGFELRSVVPFIEQMKWQEIDAATMAMFSPPGQQEFLKGWIAESPDRPPLPFLLALSRPADRANNVEVCTAMFGELDPREFQRAFIAETGAVEEGKEEAAGSVKFSYSIPKLPNIFVSLLLDTRGAGREIVATAVHLDQPEFTN